MEWERRRKEKERGREFRVALVGRGARVGAEFMTKLHFLFRLGAMLALGATLRAQLASTPTTTGTPPATLLSPGGTATVDLRNWLVVPGVNGQVAQLDTVRGTINIELLAGDAPRTVTNFLNYANRGAYTNSIFHRSVRNFVIQGGGFTLAGAVVNPIPTDAPIALENKVSNQRGTLAMARTGDLNSATSQWFINTANNAGQLDTTNGGYTVFARVLGNGMTVADAIAALPIGDATGLLGPTFNELPVLGLPLTAANLVVVRSIRVVPIYPAANGDAAVVSFSVTNQNGLVATGSVNGTTLTLTGVAPGTANVRARATDSNGSAAEAVFAVSVAASAPVISAQPGDAVVAVGQMLALNVAASGPGLAYQWSRLPGGPVVGATDPQLILNRVTAADAGIYFCTVTNATGAVDSAGAIVAVRPAGAARLSNLSVRANVNAGQVLTVGFSTTGAKALLVRGVGPALGAFNVPNFNADPRLEIYNSGQSLTAANNDWAPGLAGVFQAYGAFALAAGSADSALVTTLAGGATSQVKSATNGIVLVEVYEEVAGGPARLSNLSTIYRAGTGDDVLIAGFTVSGDVAKTLLIRGVGPALGLFNVPDRLADPKLEIYRGSRKLAENNDWNARVAAATPGLGFALDAGSKDAALLVTLPPGGYTAQLSGADGGTGTGLIEIYELP